MNKIHIIFKLKSKVLPNTVPVVVVIIVVVDVVPVVLVVPVVDVVPEIHNAKLF